MSVPRDHHYLPQFYLDRWAINGEVYRYVRPRGATGKLDVKRKPPSAIAYERDLYQTPDISDLAESQNLELKLFQRIDDRAAIALRKLDESGDGTDEDRIALSQFMVSLLHRSPSRLKAIRDEMVEKLDEAPFRDLTGEAFDASLKSTANRLLAALVESPRGEAIVSKFKTFKVDVRRSTRTLLTSDRPITVSAQLVAADAFMILPYAPDRLVILTHHEAIANAFASQPATTLVKGINEAVVEQSADIVIAQDDSARAMIDRLFLRPQKGRETDSIGLIRRRSPLVDMQPRTRHFSRHDKTALKYLGS
jgi:hypothetical protein